MEKKSLEIEGIALDNGMTVCVYEDGCDELKFTKHGGKCFVSNFVKGEEWTAYNMDHIVSIDFVTEG